MERVGRYRKRIGLLAIVRLGFAVALIGCIGGSVVTIRNRHVLKGDQIRRVEEGIEALSQEIEMWELRIASVKDRNELKRRLKWMGSNLRVIEVNRVLHLRSEGASVAVPVASVF